MRLMNDCPYQVTSSAVLILGKGIYSWVGFRQASVPFQRKARPSGCSSYSLEKMVSHALDGLSAFGGRLLYLPILAGVALVFLCCLLGFFWFISPEWTAGLADRRFLLLAIIFIGALQLLSLGLIGQFIGRILAETKKRPLYIIGESVGFESHKDNGSF